MSLWSMEVAIPVQHEAGILAVELAAGNRMVYYTRTGHWTVDFSPWLLLEAREDYRRAGIPTISEIVPLGGEGELRFLVHLPTWSDFLKARQRLAQESISHFSFSNPVRQHLLLSGEALFREMRYEHLHRLQLDLETLSLDPRAHGAGIIIAALSDNRGYEEVLTTREMSEAELLENLGRRTVDRDPDVIEGHNLFGFDLTYITVRAEALGVSLRWGRDGSELRVGQGERRHRAGARSPLFRPAYVHGRHVIDTLQQVQKYDVGGRLDTYALKDVVHKLGLQREGRVFADGDEIPRLWEADPDRLARYALDDVRDVRALSQVVVPTAFYETQILPYSFQDAALSGPGEKINALLVGDYLRRGLAIPRPRPARSFPGGYTEVLATGIFRQVVKADVESLYPSIMLAYQVRPASDTENVFLPLLKRLTDRRLKAKALYRDATDAREQAYWNGLQESSKILINSFYGYLGYGRGNFNDYTAAERVTTVGQDIAKKLVQMLAQRGAKIIEVDTDGAYFVVPPGVRTEAQERKLVEEVSQELPEGIRLSHDGRCLGMISLKAKNYVLLGYDGTLIVRGSSLRSRRDERVFRDFIERLARLLVEGRPEEASALYLDLSRRLREGEVPVEDFCRRERVSEKTFSNPNLRRLATVAGDCRLGGRISVYQRVDGSLARTEDHAGDEDTEYLCRRLNDMAGRFRGLFAEAEFRRLFPKVRKADDQQLNLF